jgi:hypothetical protein
MPRVTAVEPLDGYRLRLTFDDGAVCDADFSGMLKGELGEPLRDLCYFRRVRVDPEAGTIVWPNGLDPDPWVLHGDFEPESAEVVVVRRLAPPVSDRA